ncbi:MAG: hypothetical protein E3J64_04770 [Anaerolineales bacterium]|nr:MAG: hypothetical protein E3J64_04770 [Anaerolineales bacterium]
MSEQDEVRDDVSRAYARAVTSPAPQGGCCGGSVATKGAVATLAGYTSEELISLPPEAAVNAFGCGNPVAFSEIGEGDVVLDLGSGAGIDLLLAARKVGPGGRMLISDIVVEDLPDWIRRSAELYNSCVAGAISEEEYLDGLRAAGLDEVEVRDRLVYDACQLSALVDSGIENVEAACCGTTLLDNAVVKRALDEVAGKIWSARIFGRKP